MKQADAIALLQGAIISDQPQRWADLGCGSGMFTFALQSLLSPGSRITAIDKQTQKLPVDFIKADFENDDLPLFGLNGVLMANSIHYVSDKTRLIKKLENYFKAEPTFLIVEYDTTHSGPWVPFPISYQSLEHLFTNLRYTSIIKLNETRSRFGGHLYSALIHL
jgi:ubiquinone/menaquinone biosynthesis C-methylase UbiE